MPKPDPKQSETSRTHARTPTRRPGNAKGNGKNRRTPQQLERQERVFNLSVIENKTIREIAAEESINPATVMSDLRHEEQRRADEISERRELEKARAISFYSHVAQEGLRLAAQADGIEEIGGGDDDEKPPRLVSKAALARGLDSAIKARERQDKILGIDAPTKLDVGLQLLADALNEE